MWVRQTLRDLSCLLFTYLFGAISSGRIYPDKTLPITVSSTNALRNAEYNFTLKMDTNSIPGCFIEIVFPEQQYIDGLGLDYGFIVYSPYGNLIPSPRSSVLGKKLSVDIGYWPAMTDIVITVQGVQNPSKVGGTGMFKAYYTCGANPIDLCENFGSIAVTEPVTRLISGLAMVEPGSSDVAGELSNYLIMVQPTNDLSMNTAFRVTFPIYFNFTYLRNMVSDFPSKNPCLVVPDNTTGFVLQGNITCKFSQSFDNVIEWVGNNISIPKKSYVWLKLQNAYNPNREMKTDFLSVEAILKNTNFTYEYHDAIEGLIINPGSIIDYRLTPVLQMPLAPLSWVDFYVTFTPTNQFDSVRLVTRFRGINNCVIKNALLPIAANVPITCTTYGNIIDINGIQTYKRKYQTNADKIKLKITAKVPQNSGMQTPFELYTYKNSDFTVKADEDMTSLNTLMFISNSPPIQGSTTASVTSTAPDDPNKYVFSIHSLVDYLPTSQVTLKVIFSPLFKFGVNVLNPLTCRYKHKHQIQTYVTDASGITSIVTTDYTFDQNLPCYPDANSPSVITIPLNFNGAWQPCYADDPVLQVENTLTISNLKNPSIFGSYITTMMLYTAASPTTALESSPPSTIVIAPPPFTVTPIMYSVATSAPTLIEFKFNAPIAMAKGNRNLANYYDEFTKIVLKFQMYDTMNLFDYDLGYTSVTPVTSKIIPCWNNDDLVVYGSGLKCELFVGKSSGTLTSGDFANLVVTNYKILNKNDRVSISVMAKNVPGANPGKMTVQLINILTNEEFTIGQLAVVLPAVSSAAGAAATTCTVTASVLEVQASTDLTFTFGNLAAAAMTTNPAIMIEIPVNWQFSTSIFTPTQVFFNGNELFTGKFYYNSYNRILFITPKDDVLAGTATIVLKGIKAPEGESLTNTFKLTYFISGVRQITGTAVATPANLPIPSFTIPTVKVTTDIPYYGAKGASYYFEWTSLKYYTNPIIEITLPNPGANEYNFVVGGPYVCTLYINGTYMRSDISPFKQTCSFPAASSVFSMTFFKDIYAGSTIKIGIRYIDHFTASFAAPASVVVKTVTYDTYVGTTTAVVSKNTNVVFGNDPTVFLGPFTKANIAVTNVWAFPNSAKAKSLIYVDFTINSFLPKGTKIQVYFPPTDFTVVAYSITPYCFLKGDNKLIKSCTTYSDVTMKKVIMEIADDFVAGKAITFAFFGHSTYEINSITYDDVTTNTITPFYVDATYNTQILAETPAASYYNWRIYPEYRKLFLTPSCLGQC